MIKIAIGLQIYQYSARIHKPYKEYINNLNMFNNENKNDLDSNDDEDIEAFLAEII